MTGNDPRFTRVAMTTVGTVRCWPLVLIAAPAAVAGVVGVGRARRDVRIRDRASAARHR